jgi:CheY-like chemotaxis protein
MHILITDDLFTSRFQIGLVLKDMGFSFDEASNGEEAIELIIKRDYDLVMMDIEMPVRNGMETISYIRNKISGDKKDIKVVALTAHNPADYLREIRNAGFDGLTSKPLNKNKILTILKELNILKKPFGKP